MADEQPRYTKTERGKPKLILGGMLYTRFLNYCMSSDEWFKYNVNTNPLEQLLGRAPVVPEGWY